MSPRKRDVARLFRAMASVPTTESFPRKRESQLAGREADEVVGPGDARLVLVEHEPDGRQTEIR